MNENADVTEKRQTRDEQFIEGFLAQSEQTPLPAFWFKKTPSQMLPWERAYLAAYCMDEVEAAFKRGDVPHAMGD